MRLRSKGLLLKRLIPVSVGKRQPAESSRGIHLYLHLMPLGFALNVRRIESD